MKSWKPFRLALWALGFLLLLSGCSTAETHLWVKSPDWSRAVLLGESGASLSVPLTVRADEVLALTAPADREAQRYSLRLLRLDPATETIQGQDLPQVSLRLPRQMALADTAEGLRLFWLDDETLFTGLLTEAGDWAEAPQPLLPERPIGNFVVLPVGDGWQLLAAGTRRDPGVLALTPDGVVRLLAEDGVWVRAAQDEAGGLHVLWALYPPGYGRSALFYLYRPAGADWDAATTQWVTDLPVSTSTRLDDLALVADAGYVYAFWTTNTVAGLEAGTVITRMASAPLGSALRGPGEEIYVPLDYSLPLDRPAPADLHSGWQASLQAMPFAPTSSLEDLDSANQPASEGVLAYRTAMLHQWRKLRSQVNLLYLAEGQPAGFQPLSFTPTYSLKPQVTLDDEGYLYVTWLEKRSSETYSVYLASTHPQLVQTLAAMTWAERGNLLLATLFGLLVGALLAPLAASVWMLAPLFIQLLLGFFRRWLPTSWLEAWDWLSLGLALVAFWAAKRVTLPGMMAYVPFSAWIPGIPDEVGTVLRWGTPVLIGLFSLAVSWHYTYRRGNRASLYFLLLYIGIDALLTMAIYAVLIYGVF